MTSNETTVPRRLRITMRVEGDGRHALWHAGERVGTVMATEDAAGRFWAWNTFFRGRFGGSSQRNARLGSMQEAFTEAKAWIRERSDERATR